MGLTRSIKKPDTKTWIRLSMVVVLLMMNSCATYYQKNWNFNKEFENGDLQHALETLQKNAKEGEGRGKFIYYANNGLLNSVLGNYEQSNIEFEKAFVFGEDYRINYANEAISYLTNPNFSYYKGEDHEHLMVLYYKALNFLKLNKPEEALVECRRMNIRLNQINDKYRSEKKLQRDAFVHNLMGIIYQSVKDYNNAFIAYRNAVDIYENEYAEFFHIPVPLQLQKDLLNTAYWTGFTTEFDEYKQKFGMADYVPATPDAELVFFWHNGLAPIKDEWGINFAIDHRSDNAVVFTNQALGLAFPFKLNDDDEKKQLKTIEFFRVTFPKYQERPEYYQQADIQIDNSTFPLETTEDISQIAFFSLNQRMMEELGKGLLRAALKKAAEQSLRKNNEQLGAVVGVLNAITEKADTRSWQTLPHTIYYARVPLKEGANSVKFNIHNGQPDGYAFSYQAQKGQTLFHTFSSLESKPVLYRYY